MTVPSKQQLRRKGTMVEVGSKIVTVGLLMAILGVCCEWFHQSCDIRTSHGHRRSWFGASAASVLVTAAAAASPSSTNVVVEDSSPQLVRFHEWFLEKGGWLHPAIRLRTFEDTQFGGGNGLLTTETLPKSTKIIQVPSALTLSAQNTLESWRGISESAATRILDQLKTLKLYISDDQVVLTARLMWENCLGKDSAFEPYLNILPHQTPPTVLFTFSEHELQLLQDNVMIQVAQDEVDQLDAAWKEAVQPALFRLLDKRAATLQSSSQSLKNSGCVTRDWFDRYYAVVISHNTILDETPYMVPMADQINHATLVSTAAGTKEQDFSDLHYWENPAGDKITAPPSSSAAASVAVLTDRITQADDQVLEEYSRLDNSLYLSRFGFVPMDNPHHCSLLGASLMVQQLETNMQLAFLKLEPRGQSGMFCIQRDGSIPHENDVPVVHAMMTAFSLTGKQHEQCKETYETYMAMSQNPDNNEETVNELMEKARKACTTSTKPVSRQVQHNFLSKTAKAAIKALPTTLKEDEELLIRFENQGDLHTPQELLALQFRIEEKKVLDALANL